MSTVPVPTEHFLQRKLGCRIDGLEELLLQEMLLLRCHAMGLVQVMLVTSGIGVNAGRYDAAVDQTHLADLLIVRSGPLL